jgi:DNA polymerase-3 subunit delta
VKVNARNAEGFARNPSPGVHAVLIYGPDFGLVQERAVTILASTGVELNDPFSAVTLRGDAIAREPARLLDEATSISFQGGTRIVRVQGATDTICDSVAPLFERSIENVLIVLEAGELGPRSRLRRLFEATEYGAALACYLDDDFERERVLEGYIRDEGKSVEKSALSYLASHLSGDRALARREVEKLLLYTLKDSNEVTLQQSTDCVGDEAEHVLEDIAMAVCSGNTVDVSRAYERCMATGQPEISVLRSLARHLLRLHIVSSARDGGIKLEDALSALRPPVFFKEKAVFVGQTMKWTTVRLQRALDIVLSAERSCKKTHAPGHLICERTLLQITNAAGRS